MQNCYGIMCVLKKAKTQHPYLYNYSCPCNDKTSLLITSAHLYLPLASFSPAPTPRLRPMLPLKNVTACRYTACLAGGGAAPGQTEGEGGGAH